MLRCMCSRWACVVLCALAVLLLASPASALSPEEVLAHTSWNLTDTTKHFPLHVLG